MAQNTRTMIAKALATLSPDLFEETLTAIRETAPEFYSFIVTPKIKHDRKTRDQYEGPRSIVKSTKVTKKEAPILLALGNGELTTKALAEAAGLSINQLNGALSMLIAKAYVTTERKSVDGTKVARWVALEKAGTDAYAAYLVDLAKPKPEPKPKAEKSPKPKSTDSMPTWCKTTKVSASNDWELDTSTVDDLDEHVVNEDDQTFSEVWTSLKKKSQEDLNSAQLKTLV